MPIKSLMTMIFFSTCILVSCIGQIANMAGIGNIPGPCIKAYIQCQEGDENGCKIYKNNYFYNKKCSHFPEKSYEPHYALYKEKKEIQKQKELADAKEKKQKEKLAQGIFTKEDPGKITKGDCINGKGTYILDNGDIYVGNWKDGKYHGFGIYTSSKLKYSGNWENNQRSGKGTCKYKDGAKYIGKWKYNKYNGKGTYTNGHSKYVGEWYQGSKSGKGTYKEWGHMIIGQKKIIYRLTYKGLWDYDLYDGYGNLLIIDGSEYLHYKGMFKSGKKHGSGILLSRKGKIIKNGTWIKDEFVERWD